MIFCIAVSAGLSALLCFLGKRAGVLDSGDGERKLQTSPAVPIGGVAIYSAFMLSMTLQNVSGKLPFSGAPTVVPIPSVQSDSLLAFLAFSGGGVALFGFLDDLRPMKPAVKLLLQSVCLALGIPLFSAASGAGGISLFLLFLFLILSINVYNLIDGIDGLCASVCAVSFCILAVSTGFSGCVLLFFAALGFLPFNLPPARCYLGASGSQFLGL
ncbi:MAG: hypothetical protein MJ082_05080, partial [Clostridia bacterium]|nr:hypothetical protein [Clostridia bacterium]